MTHKEKIDWMIQWAFKNKVMLELEGECGFGRECVGITAEGHYPDYHWYDEEYNYADDNGQVWTPEDAYHKHECVAVLGRGEKAEEQLYEWLKWFDENNFSIERSDNDLSKERSREIAFLMGKHRFLRMVKKTKTL